LTCCGKDRRQAKSEQWGERHRTSSPSVQRFSHWENSAGTEGSLVASRIVTPGRDPTNIG